MIVLTKNPYKIICNLNSVKCTVDLSIRVFVSLSVYQTFFRLNIDVFLSVYFSFAHSVGLAHVTV